MAMPPPPTPLSLVFHNTIPDGLMTEFGRPDAVEDIMTEAKGSHTGLMA